MENRKASAIFFFFLLISPLTLLAQPLEVGQWRTHFALGSILDIFERGDEIWAVKPTGAMLWDAYEGTVDMLDRTKGLSGTGISAAAYSSIYNLVLLGYENGNIDFVYPYDVYTITDISDKITSGGKSILSIDVDGRYAYLGTSFGVVELDLAKEEIKSSYFIGKDNAYVKVESVVVNDSLIYALTDEGLKVARKGAPNLNDFNAWLALTDSSVDANECVLNGEDVFLIRDFDVCRLVGKGNFPVFYDERDCRISTATTKDDLLVLGLFDTLSNTGKLIALDSQGTRVWTMPLPQSKEASAVQVVGNIISIGTTSGEMFQYEWNKGYMTGIKTTGPLSDSYFRLYYGGHSIVAVSGGYTSYFAPVTVPFELSAFDSEKEKWTLYDRFYLMEKGIPEAFSSSCKAVEVPGKPGHFFAASSHYGLLEITENGDCILYTPENSPLEYNTANQSDCRIFDLDFDAQGNLWVLNNYAEHGLHMMDADGNWRYSYDLRGLGFGMNRMNSLLIDYWQQKWILFGNADVGIFKTDGSSITGLKVDLNAGNDLLTSTVFCMIEDDLGHMWFGTDRGVKVIDQHARMFEAPVGNVSSIHAKTVQVPRDGFLINLLGTDQVKAIAVDGANRKWLGTGSNGVYLVSSDGMEEIAHFTMENSPLLSNSIIDIEVDDRTGEVFFATDKGLISYRGTATRTQGEPKGQVIAFPNPVRPDYFGYINIKGLPNNSIVKITDAQGGLIFQGKATGGQLSWDGKNMHGLRPHSGVLFVYACGEDGSQAVVCKIFYIR